MEVHWPFNGCLGDWWVGVGLLDGPLVRCTVCWSIEWLAGWMVSLPLGHSSWLDGELVNGWVSWTVGHISWTAVGWLSGWVDNGWLVD